MIYLDHNATTPILPEVRAAMAPVLDAEFGNPSSAHAGGRAARAAVEDARGVLAEAIGARPSEVLFTSGGTESNNLAVLGSAGDRPHAHLVVATVEHASVVAPARELERRGAAVTWLAVDGEGRVDPAAVAAALRPDTALVSVGWANGEIGTVQDIAAIATECRGRSVVLHVDAVQALGKLPVDVAGLDLCSFSAHKIGGPKGVGALFVRRGLSLRPLIFGGSQERGTRPGTENVPGIVGFGAAVGAIRGDVVGVATLRERLWRGLDALGGVRRNSPVKHVLANTLHVSCTGLRGESIAAALDLEGVAVSVGAACAAGGAEPSHVLGAIGRSDDEAREGLRFSLGHSTTAAEIDAALDIVAGVLARMRRLSARVAHG